ncbi:MAG: PSD1 domain-containing protein [Planctomycetales bacterium]|nr:PSD1 domain-containing protein [Planctomycetales bacterium]
MHRFFQSSLASRVMVMRVLAGLAIMVAFAPRCAAEGAISFAQDVRPVLSEHCFACHGPDEEKREADLRLDDSESAVQSGAIVPGDVDASELWRRITSDDPDTVMPPPSFNKPIDQSQRSILESWIKSGGEYQQHWSFVAPSRPTIPSNKRRHPIDAFIQEKLDEAGLDLSPRADRRTLIRRVTMDLTGLPPTPQEINAFLNDSREDAYERLVDGLFNRVTYGEHMARYWLDLARYADTHGLHLDNERSMWPYRDWVVRAFNQNIHFDDFTRWQLAGDLLNDPTRDQMIASGFNRCNVSTSEGGSIDKEWIFRYAVDRTTTMAEVWMGLTAGCAVCHDHKFDPISTHDYYSLYAFFHSAADPAMDGNQVDTPPVLKLYTEIQQRDIDRLAEELGTVKAAIEQKLDAFEYQDPATQEPRPDPEIVTTLWFEDGFPEGAKIETSGGPTKFVTRDDGQVFSGERAITRTAKGVEQDFYSSGATPLDIPANGKVFVHCFLSVDDTPETIMIQFHSGQWKHRAVWGKQEKIPFGEIKTASKRHLGQLPDAGRWVRLEVDAKSIGLTPGTKVSGFAFTQFGGTVTWDQMGIESTINKTTDPAWSWQAWKDKFGGKNNGTLPNDLRKLVRAKQPTDWTAQEYEQVWQHWRRNIYAGIDDLLGDLSNQQSRIEREIAEIEKEVPLTFVMADLPTPRESFVMVRGQYDNPGDQVQRNVPSFLPPLPHREQGAIYNRLDLANWLVSGQHPLTARVAVNRLWQQLFGTGIVRTSGDFGSQGDPPSHPELLDFLAIDFVDHDWDMQYILKTILTSETYRQSSRATPRQIEIDPDNRLLSHSPRFRWDAEVLRDQSLLVSGLLVSQVGGKPVKTYQPPDIWEPVGFGSSNTRYYKRDSGDALYRRSLYSFLKRTAPPPFMSTFDAPNREQSCSVRQRSNSPMQALQLLNDVQHVEAARHFAARMLRNGGATQQERINWGWECVTGRQPTASEAEVVLKLLQSFLDRYRSDVDSAKQLIGYGESETIDTVDPTELAAYCMVANMMLNLDEVVSKN